MKFDMKAPKICRSDYFRLARSALGVRGESRLRHQMSFLYDQIDFQDKRVLDIGGGAGRHTFYAAASGAAEVVTIEPEADGGHDHMHTDFYNWRDALGAVNTQLVDATLQSYVGDGRRFDLVLIQDAINHFDEAACIDLHRLEQARSAYADIFRRISDLTEVNGRMIISDCSPHNLFPQIGIRNPFDPAIEWHKHQTPEIWTDIAKRCGLECCRTRWSTPARLGAVGAALLGNRLGSYLFTSHFVSDFVKVTQQL